MQKIVETVRPISTYVKFQQKLVTVIVIQVLFANQKGHFELKELHHGQRNLKTFLQFITTGNQKIGLKYRDIAPLRNVIFFLEVVGVGDWLKMSGVSMKGYSN